MTCNFFTIVKSYFVCCNSKSKTDENTQTNYYLDSGENSPFSFDDLTYENTNTHTNTHTNTNTPYNTSMSSAESSSSSLEDYHLSEKQQRHLKESIQRIKKYNQKLLHQRHYAEVYNTSAW